MATKPETAFIQTVHRRLKKQTNPPLIKKLADRFTNGLPDVLYISPSGITLWVEYKVHPNKTTPIQQLTLEILMAYHQRVAVITKTPNSSQIFDGVYQHDNDKPWDWILDQLGYNHTATTTSLNTITKTIPKETP